MINQDSATRGLPKVREGKVVSSGMQKTIVVTANVMKKHPAYGKFIRSTKKFYAHDENNECSVGDIVKIIETRPLSKLKRWRLKEVIRKAE